MTKENQNKKPEERLKQLINAVHNSYAECFPARFFALNKLGVDELTEEKMLKQMRREISTLRLELKTLRIFVLGEKFRMQSPQKNAGEDPLPDEFKSEDVDPEMQGDFYKPGDDDSSEFDFNFSDIHLGFDLVRGDLQRDTDDALHDIMKKWGIDQPEDDQEEES